VAPEQKLNFQYFMKKEQILAAASMPACSQSYPAGPYRFVDREYLIISYQTHPELIAEIVPEPLIPNPDGIVLYEWIKMPDSAGFGNYTESGLVIPCTLNGESVNFVAEMFLDDFAPIAAGREIWGFPKEYAEVSLRTIKETLTGTLEYAGERVATGTMSYKTQPLDKEFVKKAMQKTQVLLKLIPDVTGKPAIAQLVAVNLEDIEIKGAWKGDARLHLIPHVQVKATDLPILRIIEAKHFITDLTLPYGRVIHDYLKD
jgi:acetoacetate decarboxylase